MLAVGAADAVDSERERSITVAGLVRGVVHADSSTLAPITSSIICAGLGPRRIGEIAIRDGIFILPLIVKAQKRHRLEPCADSGGN